MKHFSIEELICPELLKKLSEPACWLLIPQIVQTSLDSLRDDLGAGIFINGNYKGNTYKYSGVRTIDCPIGAKYSKHKIRENVMAFDLKCEDFDKLDALIKADNRKYNITRLENPERTIGWRHYEFSFKPIDKDLIVFNP